MRPEVPDEVRPHLIAPGAAAVHGAVDLPQAPAHRVRLVGRRARIVRCAAGAGEVHDSGSVPQPARKETIPVLVPRNLRRRDKRGREDLVPSQAEIRASDEAVREPRRRIRTDDRARRILRSHRPDLALPRICAGGAGDVGWISEDRRHDARRRDRIPGELGGIKVVGFVERKGHGRRHLVIGFVPREARPEVDPVVGAEKPETILQDIAAEIGAEVVPLMILQAHAGQRRVDASLENARRLERSRVVVRKPVSVKLVAPRFGDDVDDPAQSAAVLGLISARLHLDLLHELAVDCLALHPLQDVGRVDSIDDPLMLDGRRTVDRKGERATLRLSPVG